MKIQSPRVCESGILLMGAEVVRIVRRVDMTASEICFFLLEDACNEKVESEMHKWNISLTPLPKPKIEELRLPKENAHKLKILHISDTHFDPLYVEGANVECNEPLCCRSNDGMTNVSFMAAGKWGSYRCDLPKRTLEHLLDHIAETHKVKKGPTSQGKTEISPGSMSFQLSLKHFFQDIDYIIWTGDIVAHDVWMQTKENVMNVIEETVRLMSDKLPGIQVFPTIGNHERSPVNS